MPLNHILNIGNITPIRQTIPPTPQVKDEEIHINPPAIGDTFSKGLKGTPVTKGIHFLERRASVVTGFQGKIGSSRELADSQPCPFNEIYTSSAISDVLRDTSINSEVVSSLHKFITSSYEPEKGVFNFFTQKNIFPYDIDTTSIAMSALHGRSDTVSEQDLKNAAEKIVENTNEEGIIQTYFPPRGTRANRIEPTVCASAMRLVYKFGYREAARVTENYIYKVLEDRSYIEEMYFPPDAFLYYVYKAVITFPPSLEKFRPLLAENIKDRLNSTAYPLDLSMRIMVCVGLGLLKDEQIRLKVNQEKKTLESLQRRDGAWPKDSPYKGSRGMNGKELYFGSKEFSTAFAVGALHQLSQSPYFKIESKLANLRVC